MKNILVMKNIVEKNARAEKARKSVE